MDVSQLSPTLARWQTIVVLAVLALAFPGCYGRGQGARREDNNLKPYGYKAEPLFRTAQLDALKVPIPQLADAEFVNDDQICATCHETYVKTFQHNVHRGQS